MKMVMRKYFAISGFLQYYVPENFPDYMKNLMHPVLTPMNGYNTTAGNLL